MYTGPPPRIANPKGKAKPGVPASVALAAGLIPGADSKAIQESVRTKAHACVSSILNNQQSAGGMLRKLSRAAVTLAATSTGQTLPNFGLGPVNNYFTRTSLTGTDIAGLIARPKATPQFEVEWIGDTGAGRNLSSLKQLPPEVEKFVGDSKHPVNFSTGGGVKDGGKSVGLNAGLAKGNELFLLKNCPSALSTGLQVADHKRPFLWLLDQLPFFIKADRVKDCVFHIPEDAKIKADRIEENVPIFKDIVSVSYALPGTAIEAAPAPHVDHADELAAAQAEPVGQEVIEGLPAPEPEEDEISISNRERLKAEATSSSHLVSHFPKNPFCETCKIAKNDRRAH